MFIDKIKNSFTSDRLVVSPNLVGHSIIGVLIDYSRLHHIIDVSCAPDRA